MSFYYSSIRQINLPYNEWCTLILWDDLDRNSLYRANKKSGMKPLIHKTSPCKIDIVKIQKIPDR